MVATSSIKICFYKSNPKKLPAQGICNDNNTLALIVLNVYHIEACSSGLKIKQMLVKEFGLYLGVDMCFPLRFNCNFCVY